MNFLERLTTRTTVVACAMVVAMAVIGFAETDVIYTPMGDAYEAGELDLARNLANDYMDEFFNELNSFNNDIDREAAMIRLLGTIRYMLQYENRLDASDRLASDQSFIDKTEQYLYACQERYATLQEHEQSQQLFIKDEVGRCAMELIKSLEAHASRPQLDRLFVDFGAEMPEQGKAGVDKILSRSTALTTDDEAPQYVLSSMEIMGIMAAANEYFSALVAKDEARLAVVCGIQAKGSATLLLKYEENLQQGGLQSILRTTLPEPSDSTVIPSAVDRSSGLFAVSVRGIQAEVIKSDGSKTDITFDKLLELKLDSNNRWTVLVSDL